MLALTGKLISFLVVFDINVYDLAAVVASTTAPESNVLEDAKIP